MGVGQSKHVGSNATCRCCSNDYKWIILIGQLNCGNIVLMVKNVENSDKETFVIISSDVKKIQD